MEKDPSRKISKIEHPGTILQKAIEEAGMSQHELAVRTGVSDKHVSTIINGAKGISASYARKLEYALGPEKGNWAKLQTEYDLEMIRLQEENNIKEEEIAVLKNLNEILPHFLEKGFMHNDCGDAEKVLQLRSLLRVSDLSLIPQISYNAAYRLQISKNTNIDPYVLFAWQRLCELEMEKNMPKRNFSLEKLRNIILEIRKQMRLKINAALERIRELLAECGIGFAVVKHFKGAPVQGFIKKIRENKVILCLTTRGKGIDRFWFSLFHEIGHILNGDFDLRFVDFDSVKSEIEEKADIFARDTIIPPDAYRQWIARHIYESLEEIRRFAESIDVPHWAVIGRLHKDDWLGWHVFADQIPAFSN